MFKPPESPFLCLRGLLKSVVSLACLMLRKLRRKGVKIMKQDILGNIAMQRSIAGWDISEIDDEQQYLLSKDHDQICEIFLDFISTRHAQLTWQ
jgi:hypothetical protein